MPCFYSIELKENSKIVSISGEEFHHINNVLRFKIGAQILLTNGIGILAQGNILKIEKNSLTVEINQIETKEKTYPHIALAFSLLKNKNDHLIVEKATELGVKDFFPFVSERTIRKNSGNTLEKFRKTILSASKQCDNAFFPQINKVNTFQGMIDAVKKSKYLPILAYENEKNRNIWDIFPKITQSICVIIGAEGGFPDAEIDIAKSEKIPIYSLGNHILRAETAAIASVSQLMNILLSQNRNHY
ncbi:MAG: 16S rRNA (uracil(1498)-N(3))-methyltransferase [Candidatus Cloacimonetes bacterium]|nr:16S rRNA (uracil(1498)-N(3))-methyltransferase [Candidatus Cloacimonadota bacterium]